VTSSRHLVQQPQPSPLDRAPPSSISAAASALRDASVPSQIAVWLTGVLAQAVNDSSVVQIISRYIVHPPARLTIGRILSRLCVRPAP
jgi:hypothetical protein